MSNFTFYGLKALAFLGFGVSMFLFAVTFPLFLVGWLLIQPFTLQAKAGTVLVKMLYKTKTVSTAFVPRHVDYHDGFNEVTDLKKYKKTVTLVNPDGGSTH